MPVKFLSSPHIFLKSKANNNMKKLKLIMAGSVLLSLAVFQSCNSEEAIKAAQAAAETKLTAVKDSLQGAWKADVDALKATYETQIQALQDSLTSVTAKLEAKSSKTTTTKKPAATTEKKPAEEKKPNVIRR
jgi:Skp family chaperone for outer membrane proteins